MFIEVEVGQTVFHHRHGPCNVMSIDPDIGLVEIQALESEASHLVALWALSFKDVDPPGTGRSMCWPGTIDHATELRKGQRVLYEVTQRWGTALASERGSIRVEWEDGEISLIRSADLSWEGKRLNHVVPRKLERGMHVRWERTGNEYVVLSCEPRCDVTLWGVSEDDEVSARVHELLPLNPCEWVEYYVPEPDDPDQEEADRLFKNFDIRAMTLGELRSLPRPPWLIEGLLRQQSTVLVHGPTESYKTFLILDLLGSLALAPEWLGHAVKKRGPVVYVAAEGPESVPERMSAWEMANGRPIPDEAFVVVPEPVSLDNPEAVDRLCKFVREIKPVAVAIDTFSKSVGALDLDSNRDAVVALTAADRVKACGTTVILIHHPGHNQTERARGASALKQGIDTEFRVEKVADLHARITCEKMKRGRRFDPINVRLEERRVQGEEGEEPTLVVAGVVNVFAAGAVEYQQREQDNNAKRELVLTHLRDHGGEARERDLAELVGLTGGGRRRDFFDSMEREGLIELARVESRGMKLWRLPKGDTEP